MQISATSLVSYSHKINMIFFVGLTLIYSFVCRLLRRSRIVRKAGVATVVVDADIDVEAAAVVNFYLQISTKCSIAPVKYRWTY